MDSKTAESWEYSGVTVQLLDQNNNVIRTTTTSSTGAYEFDNLPPGTYYVRVTPPTGYNVTTPNSGNDNTDSDINSTTNTTGAINLGAGQDQFDDRRRLTESQQV
jgi:serine-aspartate repeat-containing protein C/D/E